MTLPRDDKGRYVPVDCPDPHCGGRLFIDREDFGRRYWRCDGLTYDREADPLRACEHQHIDGHSRDE